MARILVQAEEGECVEVLSLPRRVEITVRGPGLASPGAADVEGEARGEWAEVIPLRKAAGE